MAQGLVQADVKMLLRIELELVTLTCGERINAPALSKALFTQGKLRFGLCFYILPYKNTLKCDKRRNVTRFSTQTTGMQWGNLSQGNKINSFFLC